MKKKRDSGIELLRIFAMLMVIGVHIFVYGGYFDTAREQSGIVWSSAYFMRLFFRPAVNIFIIITGYFMVHSPFDLKKSYRRVLSVYGTILFYSVLLSIIVLANRTVFETEYTVSVIIGKMLLPLLSQEWYFLTGYILLCLFAPFINISLQKITKQEYQILLIVTTVVMSLWLCLANLDPFWDVLRDSGYDGLFKGKNVFSFIYIYLVGGYIGLYGKTRKTPQFLYLFGAFFCVVVNYLIWTRFDDLLAYEDVAMSYANPLVVLTAVFALSFFKDVHFYSKVVNIIASTTIGIYALHELEYMRDLIWSKFDFSKMDCSNLTTNLIRIAAIMMFIFLAGAMIELARQLLFMGIGKAVKKAFPVNSATKKAKN
jgi:surface polysaccharide O-acyltransferase-like enzyme